MTQRIARAVGPDGRCLCGEPGYAHDPHPVDRCAATARTMGEGTVWAGSYRCTRRATVTTPTGRMCRQHAAASA